jgi:cellulose synthase (UDP-forming)
VLNFKPLSRLRKKSYRISSKTLEPQKSTKFWSILGIVSIVVVIAIKLSIGDWSIETIWFKVPDFSNPYYIFLPSLILLAAAQIIMRVSPQPQQWSKSLIVPVLLFLTLRYLFWRSFTTLNLDGIVNSTVSTILLVMEIMMISSSVIQLVLNLNTKNRRLEADIYSQAVLAEEYQPNVDILIPTYNEPAFILKKSVIGCQAIDYTNKKIYLLDDTRRPEIEHLARELGCNYITRKDNKHAKAGNLNHAIGVTNSELIVVFDADFVPTTNFLNRTVGFFQDPRNALVQSYQSFYNPDPVARNLGLEERVPQDAEFFSRYYQPLRDAIESSICYGSSFVVRRSSLEAVGGFVTESLSEDYFTSINLSAAGNQVIFLNESLSAGLCADNMSGHILQRLRWGRGTLQAFFIRSNPLKIKGMNFWQRLAHLEGIGQWFMNTFRLTFLCVPIICTFTGILPWQTTIQEWLYFFLPFYLLQMSTFSWLNFRSRSALISDIYAVVQCVPISFVVIQTMFRPFAEKFRVTPKGVANDRHYFNLQLAYPSIVLFVLTALSMWYSHEQIANNIPPTDLKLIASLRLATIWNVYNLLLLGISILVMLDVPKANPYEWFAEIYSVSLKVGDRIYAGTTELLSEAGAEIEIYGQIPFISQPIYLEIPEVDLRLKAEILEVRGSKVKLNFDRLNLETERRLIEVLYCRPGRWRHQQTPGELEFIYLLASSIFAKAKPLFKQLLLFGGGYQWRLKSYQEE